MSKAIPGGWKKSVLGKEIKLIKGSLAKNFYEKLGKGMVPYLLIDSFNGVQSKYVYPGGLNICKEDDPILVMDGSRSGLVLKGKSGVIGSTLANVLPNKPDQLDKGYLFNVLASLYNFLNKSKTSGAVPHIDRNVFLNLPVILPPLPEQHKIASILSSVDEAIEKTKEVVKQTKEVKKGLMQELLTRGLPGRHKKYKETIVGEVPEGWEVVKVGDVCDYIVPGRNKPKIFGGEIPWITTPDIIGRKVETSQMSLSVSSDEIKRCGTRTVPEGSVIMSCVGEFGVVAIAACNIVINQQLHAFILPEDLDANFLRYCLILQKPYMEKIATKTAVPYMNKFNCNSIPIPKPSIYEQKKIADVLLSIETKKEIEQTLLTNLNYIKNALMQVLMTGEVRAIEKINLRGCNI